MNRLVGLMGLAGAGKDTAADVLTREHGYRRRAFADGVRELALAADPIIGDDGNMCLSDLVGERGWDYAKRAYPDEVRGLLQRLGAGARRIDPDIWVRRVVTLVDDQPDVPTVITDVRYPNEVAAIRDRGGVLVWVHRPGVTRLGHESERAVSAADADVVVVNDGTVRRLHRRVLTALGAGW